MARLSIPNWFKRFLVRYKRSVIVALLLGLLSAGCSALLMFTSGYLISATARDGISLFSVMIPVACVQLFGIGRPLARYLERLVSHDWVLKITSDLRLMLYRGIEKRMDDPSSARSTGEYLSLLADDIAHLQNLYLRVVFPTAIALLLSVGAVVLFGAFSLPFALVMLLVFALTVFGIPYVTLLATRARSEFIKTSRANHFAALTDDIQGATDWILANRADDVRAFHARADSAVRSDEARLRMIERILSLASTLLLGCAICLVIAWAGGRFGASASEANWIAAFVLGFFPLIESVSMLPAAVSNATFHADALARLDEYILPEDDNCVIDEANCTEDSAALAVENGEAFDANVIEPSYSVEFDCVSYAFPGTKRNAIQNVSLAIPDGQSVALLGRSGSGKTTLAQLARGVIKPDTGHVRISHAHEHAGSSLSIGYLGQEPYLFNRTLRENLSFGMPDKSDEQLIGFLDVVGLKEKYDSLENGLDTVVGETGVGFSGGEAHRIALARVLAANTPIVLVDEPFAALDPETEDSLLDALLTSCNDRTLIVITHHLAQVERFDRVVFLEDGCIELDDTPSNLMETSERFRMLVMFDRSSSS